MVYRLEYDCYNFPRIEISADEVEDKLPNGRRDMVRGRSRKDIWVTLDGDYYYEPGLAEKRPCPDISQWANSLVFSELANELLASRLEPYGELLPVNIQGDARFYFNLLNATDAIDPFNSEKELFEGVEVGVKKIAFLEHEIKDLFIFSTPYDNHAYIYCTDEFKAMIENSGLTSGWEFRAKLRDLDSLGDVKL